MLLTEQENVRKFISQAAEGHGRRRSALISILQALQDEYGEVSQFAMQHLAHLLGIHATEVYSVATFYHFISTKPKGKFVIRLSYDMPSIMKGARAVARQLENDLGIRFGETTADGVFTLEWTSCIGMNDQAPAMMVNHEVFSNLTAARVHRIIENCRQEFRSHRPTIGKISETATNHLTYGTYVAETALRKVLAAAPEDVVNELAAAGLRGRGGAGFPTAEKWLAASAATGETKYIVCNADEGEPGTFKDRVILARHADMVFEGMTIAAHVVGATEGIVYLRWEYSFLRPHLETVLAARRKSGLLGHDILGRDGFSFDIRVRMGAGAYVCGEESALLESLEGQRGEPRNRPPYPVEAGFLGCPTVVNNVETFATVCPILDQGAAWFAGMGTERSKGFKLLSVSGDCARPGVYEVAWGISVADLLALVGGDGAKAVQVGGYSGQLVPTFQFGRKIAYEDLGTGGSVIVYGPGRDMLEVAENYLEFFVNESCGQCTPCRNGNVKLLEGIRLLKRGECSTRYLEDLLELCATMQVASKCGLGQTSPNVLLAVHAHFQDDIVARSCAA